MSRRLLSIVKRGVAGLLALAICMTTAAPASAVTWMPKLCSGFAQCNAQGHGSSGYERVYQNSFWGMYAGHNCTNYVAYRLLQNGVDASYLRGHGEAYQWSQEAAKHGVPQDRSPRVGDVAWFSAATISAGHVAYVESVNFSAGTVVASEDNYGGDFDYRTYHISDVGQFIHFGGRASSGAVSAESPPGTYLADGFPGSVSTLVPIGSRGDVPLLCDWDGNGTDTLGVFRRGTWYVRNSNRPGADVWVFSFGNPTDQPLCGDWNGDGKDTPGVFRAGHFYLRNSATSGAADGSFTFGNPTDVAITGSWNGDRFDTVGVTRSTPAGKRFYLANSNLVVRADVTATFGNGNDVPLAGDWNNNGTTSIGVFRAGTIYLSDNLTPRLIPPYRLGNPTDTPVVGRTVVSGPTTVSVGRGY